MVETKDLLESKREVTGWDVFEAMNHAYEKMIGDPDDVDFYRMAHFVLAMLFDDKLYSLLHEVAESVMKETEKEEKREKKEFTSVDEAIDYLAEALRNVLE